MGKDVTGSRRGYTVVELMATIVIAVVLAATAGTFFAKLLSIQERDREEAYVREKLSDICGAYADWLSVGASIITSNRATVIKYRHETGGVSLETGLVTRVAYLTSSINTNRSTLAMDIDVFEAGQLTNKLSRIARGDASLIPLVGDMVSCTITPLGGNIWEEGNGVQMTDSALGYLEVTARYEVENDDGEVVATNVTAGRLVRLWNRE